MPAAKPSFPKLRLGHPLGNGLVGSWAFGEGSGPTVYDLSGQGHNGTFTGSGLSWTGGQSGWSFNSTAAASSYVNCGSSAGKFASGQSFTIAVTCYLTANANQYGLLNKGNDDSGVQTTPWYMIRINTGGAAGVLNFYLVDTSVNVYSSTITVGTGWHTLIGVYDAVAGTNILYADGIAGTSGAPVAQAYGSTAANLQIANGSANNFLGQVDCVHLYSRALGSLERALIFEDPFAMLRPRRTVLKVAGGVTFTRSLSDNIAIADAPISRFVNTFRALSDNIGITDQPNVLTNTLRALSDNIGITDQISRLVNTLRLQQDNIGITDQQIRLANALRAVIENIGITDNVPGRLASAFRVTSDNVGLTDSQARLVQSFRALLDTLGITDTQTAKIATGIIWHLIVSENIGLGELFTRRIPVSRVIPAKWGPLPGRGKFPNTS